jgi:hypothetical protein
MASIANVVLADGQASPVNKTFTPKDCTSTLASWTDRTSGIPIGQPQLTLSMTEGKDTTRVTFKVVVPTLETTSTDGVAGYVAAPKVAYQVMGKVDLVLPNRASLQERKNIQAFVKNMLANAFVTKAVEEFERPY